MIIDRLTIRNVKGIQYADIVPDGSLVIIGGENGAGKSTAIDSIRYAFGGKGLLPVEPIRHGQEKAQILVKTDRYTIKVVITKKGAYFELHDPEGVEITSPLSKLKSFYNDTAFDPLDLYRKNPKEQVRILCGLLGIDLSKRDDERRKVYDERRDLGRDHKRLAGLIEATPKHDAPETPLDVGAMRDELQRGENVNRENADRERELARVRGLHVSVSDELKQLQALVEAKSEQLAAIGVDGAKLAKAVKAQEDRDLSELNEAIAAAAMTNRHIESNLRREQIVKEDEDLVRRIDDLTSDLERIDIDGAKEIADAEMPVEGLTFDAETIRFNGVPLNQCATSEAIRVSTAIGFASNPELKVVLIKDASLLDAKSQKAIEEITIEKGGQVWLEKVGTDHGEGAFILEDGTVKGGSK